MDNLIIHQIKHKSQTSNYTDPCLAVLDSNRWRQLLRNDTEKWKLVHPTDIFLKQTDRTEEHRLHPNIPGGGVVRGVVAGVGGQVGVVLVVRVVGGGGPSRQVLAQPSKQQKPLSGQSGGE